MTSDLFESNQAFLDQCGISKSKKYYDPILFTDTKYGFSVKRNYPSDIRYKPALKKNGEPDNAAVFWVSLEEEKKSKDGKVPLIISVNTFSLWSKSTNLSNYQEDNQDSPTKVSVEDSEKTPKPLGLVSQGDFYYDTIKNCFFHKNGGFYPGEEILNYIFQEHCDTVHLIKGVEYKIKLLFKKARDLILLGVIWLLTLITEKIFRNKLTHKEEYLKELPLTLTTNPFANIQSEPGDKFSIVGDYKASKSTILIFCTIVILLNVLRYWESLKLEYYDSISKDTSLIVVHVIFALAIIEIFPRIVLFPFLNLLIKWRARMLFATINPFSYKEWLLPLIYLTIYISLIY